MQKQINFKNYKHHFDKDNFNAFNHNITYGIDFSILQNKIILDIGSGNGKRTCYYALQGKAKKVIGIDNYAGEGGPKFNKWRIRQLIESLKINNVDVVIDDYLSHTFPESSFDVIFATDSLHHLFSSEKRVSHDKYVFDKYANIIKKIFFEMKPGGILYIRELQRYSLSQYLPFWNSQIHWNNKQQASDWCFVIQSCGFQNCQVHYYTPYRLRHFSILLNNIVANYFLKSVYVITAQRKLP